MDRQVTCYYTDELCKKCGGRICSDSKMRWCENKCMWVGSDKFDKDECISNFMRGLKGE